MSNKGWVGFDLDGTLARYNGWKGIENIGEPIPPMLEYARELIKLGVEVRIVTARVQEGPLAIKAIEQWCLVHFGKVLPVTDKKDFSMVALFDDRAYRVEKNNGWVDYVPTSRQLARDVLGHWDVGNADAPKEVKGAA